MRSTPSSNHTTQVALLRVLCTIVKRRLDAKAAATAFHSNMWKSIRFVLLAVWLAGEQGGEHSDDTHFAIAIDLRKSQTIKCPVSSDGRLNSVGAKCKIWCPPNKYARMS